MLKHTPGLGKRIQNGTGERHAWTTKKLTRDEKGMACNTLEAHGANEGTSRSTEALLPEPTKRACLVCRESAEPGNLGTIAQRLDLLQTPKPYKLQSQSQAYCRNRSLPERHLKDDYPSL